MLAILSLVGTLTGCTNATEESECETPVTLTPVYPTYGQAAVYNRSPLRFTLSASDENASVSLDLDGSSVVGATSVEDLELTFIPDAPLLPNSEYQVTLVSCGTTAEMPFTTSDLGSPLTQAIAGQTFAVDPDSGRVLAPKGGEAIVSAALGGVVLMGIVSEGTQLEIDAALSNVGDTSQDTCNRTLQLPPADFSESPYFEIPASDLVLAIGSNDVVINDLAITGTFRADGTGFEGGTLSAELDLREIGPILGELSENTPEELCEILDGLNIACAPCQVDQAAFCIDVLLDQVSADLTDQPVSPIVTADCHEDCALSCDNLDCEQASTYEVCE
ncbi:MAG: hypothetical protein ACI9VR_001539 [Cognaticolwellia sp.]|jgi:hypothetical protein